MIRAQNTVDGFGVSPGGLLYFETQDEIYRREANGTLTFITGDPAQNGIDLGPVPVGATSLINDPVAMAVDDNGTLYMLEAVNGIVRAIADVDGI
jgi:hypothetical protein